jgi:hypothetical protein
VASLLGAVGKRRAYAQSAPFGIEPSGVNAGWWRYDTQVATPNVVAGSPGTAMSGTGAVSFGALGNGIGAVSLSGVNNQVVKATGLSVGTSYTIAAAVNLTALTPAYASILELHSSSSAMSLVAAITLGTYDQAGGGWTLNAAVNNGTGTMLYPFTDGSAGQRCGTGHQCCLKRR